MEYLEINRIVLEAMERTTDIAPEQNLLEEGLTSIQTMKIISHLREQGVRLRFSQLMKHPTLRKWQELAAKQDVGQAAKPLEAVVLNRRFALTDVQYAYMVGREDDQVLGGISCHAYLEFAGTGLAVERMHMAWTVLLKHHPMLRACFHEDGTQEIVDAPFSLEMPIHDFRDCSEGESEYRLAAVRDELSHRKLDIKSGQVTGLQVSLLPGGRHVVHFDLELLVADVKSLQILLRDLGRVYCGEELDCESSKWNFQKYLDVSARLNAGKREVDKRYWEGRLVDFPLSYPIPVAKNPDAIRTPAFMRRIIRFDRGQRDGLQAFARRNNTTEAILLLTAYVMTIERWSEQSHFMINIPLFNRNLEFEGVEDAVADFTSLLLLEIDARRIRTEQNGGFEDMLSLIKDQFYKDMEHTAYSGVEVQRDLAKKVGEQCNIAPLVFACNLGMPLTDQRFEDNIGTFSYMISQTPQIWLDFQSYEDHGGLMLTWDSIDELFCDGMIDDMHEAFHHNLLWLISRTENRAAQYQDVCKREFDHGLLQAADADKQCLHSVFANMARQYPDNIAIVDSGDDREYTYREISRYAKVIAGNIARCTQEKTNIPIAVSLEKGMAQIAAVLGILFSGNCYVPVATEQPLERRNGIQEKIGIDYVISRDSYAMEWQAGSTVIDIDMLMAGAVPDTLPVVVPEDTAYIIMTSGSTGEPKGVEIAHGSAWNTIADINDKYGVGAGDRTLAISGLDFDLSVYDIFGLLAAGGAIVTIPSEENKNAAYWLEMVEKQRVTIWNTVPILFDMFMVSAQAFEKENLPLRVILLSGDWINLDTPRQAKQVAPGSRLIALGGATEGSIWSNYYEVKLPIPGEWNSIPYGRPLKHQAYRIVDAKGRDCPDWVKGELWIGGVGVAKGYKGDDLLTQAKFPEYEGMRWYRTGDLGRFWNDRNIEFLGRQDSQVKIRGHRIEIGEIEAALSDIPLVREAVVAAPERVSRKKYLVGFIIAAKRGIDEAAGKEEIIAALERKIPHYMIPMTYYFLDELPLNRNGKVDRKRLCAMALERDMVNTGSDGSSETEVQIRDIWRDVFGLPDLNIRDNYFQLGGDSLTATRIITRMKEQLGLEVSIASLFGNPTIEQLAKMVQKPAGGTDRMTQLPEMREGHSDVAYPLTDIQYAYWVGRQNVFALGMVSSHTYYELSSEDLDLGRLEAAWNTMVRTHDVLRAVVANDGMSQTVIQEVAYYQFAISDFRQDGQAVKWKGLCKIRSEMEEQVLDVSRWPVFDIRASLLAGGQTIVHLSFDNIVLDAGSIMKLLYDWTCLYRDDSRMVAENPAEGEMPVSFADYVYYLQDLEKTLVYERSQTYWQRRLPDFPELLRPSVRKPAEALEMQRFGRLSAKIEKDNWVRIKQIAGRYSVTPSMLLLTAYAQILGGQVERQRFSIVLTLLNRLPVHRQINKILGDFTSTMLLDITLDDSRSYVDNVSAVQTRFTEDMQHRYYSGVRFQRELHKQNATAWNNEMPVVFTSTLGLDNHSGELFGEIAYHITQTPQVWLDYQVQEVDGELICNWDYVEEMFEPDAIGVMFEQYMKNIWILEQEESWLSIKNACFVEGEL
ncbi:MAG: amino acid adenylation domain-containing protein [Lachnospiraceae bacterium]